MTTTRRTVLATLLVALTVAAGQSLAAVPNVELVTILVFVSGYLLGPAMGAVVGATAMAVHSSFNALGAAAPPVLVAQIVAYAAVGACGRTVGRKISTAGGASAVLMGAATGAVSVTVYQILVNLASYVVFPTGAPLWSYLAGGMVFAAVQVAWNAVLFGTVVRPVLGVCRRVAVREGLFR